MYLNYVLILNLYLFFFYDGDKDLIIHQSNLLEQIVKKCYLIFNNN